MAKHLPLLFLLLSLVFAGAGLFYLWQRYRPLSSVYPATAAPGTAFLISIPQLNIKLPIYPAAYDNSRWEYTSKGVSHLNLTPQPGDTGNSVFYGHNWPNLLGKLKSVTPGQIIEFHFSDNSIRKFTVISLETVSPDRVDVIDPTVDTRVTIYTCTGFLDRQRLVITAFPV